ncbi:MAG: hypothetical protein AAF353_17590, partial [Pseudomonadota bacterium]
MESRRIDHNRTYNEILKFAGSADLVQKLTEIRNFYYFIFLFLCGGNIFRLRAFCTVSDFHRDGLPLLKCL